MLSGFWSFPWSWKHSSLSSLSGPLSGVDRLECQFSSFCWMFGTHPSALERKRARLKQTEPELGRKTCDRAFSTPVLKFVLKCPPGAHLFRVATRPPLLGADGWGPALPHLVGAPQPWRRRYQSHSRDLLEIFLTQYGSPSTFMTEGGWRRGGHCWGGATKH